MKLQEIFFYRISPRTPVTQDDPLGALNINEDPLKEEKITVKVPENDSLRNSTIYTDQPILFKGQRSATFDESTQLHKSMQRSKTMPASSAASSFVGLGSSFKFNFG